MIAERELTIERWQVERVVQPELPLRGTTPTSRLWLGAAMLLERDGWQRGAYGSADPNVHEARCVVGALQAAGWLAPDGLTLDQYGIASVPFVNGNLVTWNDRICPSQDAAIGRIIEVATAIELDAGAEDRLQRAEIARRDRNRILSTPGQAG